MMYNVQEIFPFLKKGKEAFYNNWIADFRNADIINLNI